MNSSTEDRMTKIAEYAVERIAVYANNTRVVGQIKTLSIYTDDQGRTLVQIGNGKKYFYAAAASHATRTGFTFGDTKPQRWARI